MVEFDFEDEFDDADVWSADFGDEGDAALSVSLGLFPVLDLWRQLGALDEDDRLTELGWWGIPESLDRAWQPSSSDDD
ncbi:hypothetical protein MWU75_10000 [Ornithinimicrobium sp. F0845]|nr:hypothetical protein [Ornithinimicrobium sp. F0845]